MNDWFILYHFSNNREVIQEKNLAVAIVEGATYLASAYIVGGAFYDWETGFAAAIAWFIIGQLLLILLAFLYRAVARGVFAALDDHNTAVAISLGGFLLAGGIVCGAVISGPSKGWQRDLQVVSIYMIGWLALVVAAHFISDLLVLRSSRVRDEVMEQRNMAMALLKAVVFPQPRLPTPTDNPRRTGDEKVHKSNSCLLVLLCIRSHERLRRRRPRLLPRRHGVWRRNGSQARRPVRQSEPRAARRLRYNRSRLC